MAITHSELGPGQGGVHGIQNWEVANAAARLALSVTASDVGKVALQTDNDSLWILTDDTGPTWKSLAGVSDPPDATLAEATVTAQDTSQVDVLVPGMTLTPAAGTYLVSFTGSLQASLSQTFIYTSIYVDGVQVAASERDFRRPGNVGAGFACVAKVTVNGAQAVEGRWRTTQGTMSMFERTLSVLEVA